MLYLGLLKRFVPFVITFAAGLLIASFFVSVALPSRVRGPKGHGYRMLKQENIDLKEENRRLREELNAAETRADWYRNGLESVPAPAVPELPTPPPMRKAKSEKLVVLQ